MLSESRDPASRLRLVRRTIARELEPQALPDDHEDLSRAGLVDSMTRVNILLALEEVIGVPDLSARWPDHRPFSVQELATYIAEVVQAAPEAVSPGGVLARSNQAFEVSIAGWGSSPGSLLVTAEEVDRECGFSPGFLRSRTGIESVRRASEDEDELALAVGAAQSALEAARLSPADVDLLVTVSTTFLGLPSFAASMHARLLLRESVGAIDVGGACVGVINAFAVAKSLLPAVGGRAALMVASEVNSRRLLGFDSPPDFRALFGDAACAFALKPRADEDNGKRLRGFAWGCSSTSASALRLLWPNPRVLNMLCQKAGIPLKKVPQTSKTWGNLGSVTCGVNLCKALSETHRMQTRSHPATILAAAVGPGLLWGGSYIGSR